jgi:hypothetical protein
LEKTMNSEPDKTDGCPFTPLDRLLMELFRTINPNAASLSLRRAPHLLASKSSSIATAHLAATDADFPDLDYADATWRLTRLGPASLSQGRLRAAVEREFLTLDEHERGLRLVLAKMEGDLIRRMGSLRGRIV